MMPNKIVALASIMAISIVAVVMPAMGGVDKAKVEEGLTVTIDESLIPEPELKKPEEVDVCKPNDPTKNQQLWSKKLYRGIEPNTPRRDSLRFVKRLPQYRTSGGKTFRWPIIPSKPDEPSIPPVCVDTCGDGFCAEIVCAAVGCPCPETPESCPDDCKVMD